MTDVKIVSFESTMFSKSQKLIALLLSLISIAALIWLSQESKSFGQRTLEAFEGQSKSHTRVSFNQDAPKPFAFIELFTSEGCSSCPSADENLERIAAEAKTAGTNVYTLSYHVDYWNRLGWTDPYSSSEFTDRQRHYAAKFSSDRVYTPQIVVNGVTEFVGSNSKVSDRAVETALELAPLASIEIEAELKDSIVNVRWQAKGINGSDAVNVALVQNSGQQQVTRGENARRKLSHVNIVRDLKTDRQPGASGTFSFDTPDNFSRDAYHVMAFIQSDTSVVAASRNQIGAASLNAVSQSTMQDNSKPNLVGLDRFFNLMTGQNVAVSLSEIETQWHVSYTPMILEVLRFLPLQRRAAIMAILERKTGKQFGNDLNRWHQWNWSQEYDAHPDYAIFKSVIYQNVDPRFGEYFADTDDARIRLDEIRWGGVVRDGIPPLKDPKMLAVDNADYLGDDDVVFGIELNGDARCYPKRILAWHEMFKDTIGGESVCGVY